MPLIYCTLCIKRRSNEKKYCNYSFECSRIGTDSVWCLCKFVSIQFEQRIESHLRVHQLQLPIGTPSGSTTSNGSSSSSTSSAPLNGTSTAGPSALQLAAGMLKLVGTSNAVTSQEATQLLPLWQSLQQIESAMPQGGGPRPQGTPGAPQPNPTMMAMRQQVAAQIMVIENAMPPAQIQAITAMNLTGQDMLTAFQQAGITMGGPGRGGFGSSNGGTFTPPQGVRLRLPVHLVRFEAALVKAAGAWEWATSYHLVW